MHRSNPPSVSADGHRYTYTLDALSNEAALDNLVVAVKDGAKPLRNQSTCRRFAFSPETWKSLEVVVEWGFQEGTEQRTQRLDQGL